MVTAYEEYESTSLFEEKVASRFGRFLLRGRRVQQSSDDTGKFPVILEAKDMEDSFMFFHRDSNLKQYEKKRLSGFQLNFTYYINMAKTTTAWV